MAFVFHFTAGENRMSVCFPFFKVLFRGGGEAAFSREDSTFGAVAKAGSRRSFTLQQARRGRADDET